ncbi:MAG: hypothetical protein GF418_17290, partial [Chitinivibrionales bacterium]|nr:hypothetical protein [Chitinivibrionales bacterium]MBD3397375.1 hypothetical protein [Chitinivibrionales bacterium]
MQDERRHYRPFQHKDAVFRICCDAFDAVAAAILSQRALLEDYLRRHPEFATAREPLDPLADAPPVARDMAR